MAMAHMLHHQQHNQLASSHELELLHQQQAAAAAQGHLQLWPPQQQQQQMPAVQYPRSALRPGKVVWAKVEGHDWWPACIVRRRAVPKEVGPPPGGQVCAPEHTDLQQCFSLFDLCLNTQRSMTGG
jgi:hypothetical protein